MKIQFNTEEEAIQFKEEVLEIYKERPIALMHKWELNEEGDKFYYDYIPQLHEFITEEMICY